MRPRQPMSEPRWVAIPRLTIRVIGWCRASRTPQPQLRSHYLGRPTMSMATRPGRLSLLLASLLVLRGVLAGPVTAAESLLPGAFRGASWGNSANAAAGDLATALGRSAYQPCPCRGTDGRVLSNVQNDVDTGDDTY